MTNYATLATIATLNEKVKSGEVRRAYDDCARRFTVFYILNNAAYMEACKVVDVLEETYMFKHGVKKIWNNAEKHYARYLTTMRTNLPKEAWFLLQDYCTVAYNNAENDEEILYFSYSNYLLRNRCFRNNKAIARLCVVLRILEFTDLLWDEYFKTYRELCGIDFSKSFDYAHLTDFRECMKQLIRILEQGNPKVSYEGDTHCDNAAVLLMEKLSDKDRMDNAAIKAIGFSEHYSKEYYGN